MSGSPQRSDAQRNSLMSRCLNKRLETSTRAYSRSPVRLRISPPQVFGLLLFAIGSAACHEICQAQAAQSREVFDKAVTDFKNGRIEESVAGFDRLIKLAPDVLPQLWQRGIALYYVGRF